MRLTRASLSKLRFAAILITAAALVASVSGCGLTGSASDKAGETALTNQMAPDSMGMERSVEMAEESAMEPTVDAAVNGNVSDVAAADRMIIKTAGLRLEVDDVEASVESVRAATSRHDGQVTNVQISTQDQIPVYRYDAEGSLADGAALSGYITARVPAEAYDEFLSDVRDIGEVVRQNENESDVTQQHIDLQARLTNLEAQEAQLREFFDQAANVEDLLAIEQELTRVRAEIDGLTGQIAYLERQAAMSTVTIELVEPKPVIRPENEGWGFIDAITAGIQGAAGVLRFAISFVIATSPVWLSAVVVFLVVRFFVKRHHRTTEKQPPVEIQ